MKSISSELTGFGCVDMVVADSATELEELLFLRSEEDEDAVDGSLVAPGVFFSGDDAMSAGGALPLANSVAIVAVCLPSLTYSVVSSFREA